MVEGAPKLNRRDLLRGAGALGLAALTSGSANAADQIKDALDATEAMKQSAAKFADEVSSIFWQHRGLVVEKLPGNPDAEGRIMKLETKYLNAYASETYGLEPDGRTSAIDAQAFELAISQMQKPHPDAARYIIQRQLEEMLKDATEPGKMQEYPETPGDREA